jgi:hypothetical protein
VVLGPAATAARSDDTGDFVQVHLVLARGDEVRLGRGLAPGADQPGSQICGALE